MAPRKKTPREKNEALDWICDFAHSLGSAMREGGGSESDWRKIRGKLLEAIGNAQWQNLSPVRVASEIRRGIAIEIRARELELKAMEAQSRREERQAKIELMEARLRSLHQAIGQLQKKAERPNADPRELASKLREIYGLT